MIGKPITITLPIHTARSKVYHTNLRCSKRSLIAKKNRRTGTGGKELCFECERLAARQRGLLRC